MNRMRLPRKGSIVRWIERSYGMENYSSESNYAVMKSLKSTLVSVGGEELAFLGKLLLKLSYNPGLARRLMKELEEVL